MLRSLILIVLSVFCTDAFSTDLKLSQLKFTYHRLHEKNAPFYFVDVTVSWDNAWHNNRNHDAAWIFFKYVRRQGGSMHAKVLGQNHVVINGTPALNVVSSEDGMGVFVHASKPFRGNVEARIRIQLDTTVLANRSFNVGDFNLQAYGIEMVYIPQGKFFAGDVDSLAVKYGSFFKVGKDGKPAGLYEITGEDQKIAVGKSVGDLYYRITNPEYEGDQTGVVGAAFPKGYAPYYCMKYELTQGQYADFLNTLSLQTIPPRAKFMFADYEYFRGSITLSDKRFVATSPARPANFVSWDDGMAYADWAGLRPMTELEFEKAARGTVVPKPKDYPWGTSSLDNLKRFVNENNDVVWAGLSEKDLTDENRDQFGASFYWVMDLSGSIWERCITIGSEAGRNYKGTHGDGATNYGYATNEDWPAGDHKSSGFGFRGGGFYELGLSSDVHVPFSPVAFRRYGAWAGGYATQAYGQRFVRSIK